MPFSLRALFQTLSAGLCVASSMPGQVGEDYVPRDNLQLWLKADSLTLANGATVAMWSDSSGNANHAVQETAANRPSFTASVAGLGGKPAVEFTSSAKTYFTVPHVPGLMPSEAVTVIAVASRTGAATSAMMIAEKGITGGTDSGYSLRFQSPTSAGHYVHANGTLGTISTGSYYILSGTYDRSVNTLHINGQLADENPYTVSIAPRATALSVGGRLAASTLAPANNLDGGIAELLVYGRALDQAQRRDVEAYLHSKYGVGSAPTANLPSFSVNTGTYGKAQTVALTCAEMPGSTIRFTLDGAEPTESSEMASGPIAVTTTTTLKARAFKLGYTQPTEPAIAVITINPDTVHLPRQGLKAWFRADALQLAQGAQIQTWPDQSGNRNDAVPSGSAKPTYNAVGPNGMPAVTFAAGQWLAIPPTDSLHSNQISVFAVVKRSSGTGTAIIAEKFVPNATTGNKGFSLWMPNATSLRHNVNGSSATIPASSAAYYLAEGIYDQTKLEVRVNRAAPATAALSGAVAAVSTPLYVGGRAGANTFVGEIAELLIYERGLSEAERVDVEAYLHGRYDSVVGTEPKLAAPTFNLLGGTYAEPQQLRISGPMGAVVKYREGTSADEHTYSGAITIPASSTTHITAWAEKLHYDDSEEVSVSLTVDEDLSLIPRDGLEVWLRADTLDPTSEKVANWPDLSGKGNHATQATELRRPTYTSSAPGIDKPAVQFAGGSNSQHLIIPDSPAFKAKNVTIFAVASRTTKNSNWDPLVDHRSGTTGYALLFGSGADTVNAAANSTNINADVLLNQFYSLCMVAGKSEMRLHVNDAAPVVADFSGTVSALNNDMVIGGAVSTADFAGNVAEVMVFSRELTPDEVTDLQRYAFERYGLGLAPKVVTPRANFFDGEIAGKDAKLILTAGSQATIYYTTETKPTNPTLEALPPSQPWLVYSGPIALDGAHTYRYRATRPGHRLSDEGSVRVIGDATAENVINLRPNVWFRADSWDPASGSEVERWRNSSVFGEYDVTQATASRRPAYIPSDVDLNERPALGFNGSSNWLRTAGPSYLSFQTGSIFVVAKGSTGHIFADFNEGPIYNGEPKVAPEFFISQGKATLRLLDSNPLYGVEGGHQRYRLTARSGTFEGSAYGIVRGEWSARQNVDVFVNYDKSKATRVYTQLPDDEGTPFIIGAARAGVSLLNGAIAEVLVFDRILSERDAAKIEGYLNNRYGINPMLPAPLTPQFSPATGTYAEPQKVTISSDAGAHLRYAVTGLGEAPASLSLYDKTPINVASSKTITARAAYGSNEQIPYGAASDLATANITIDASTADVARKGLKLWLRADSLTLADGAAVALWEDQSGSSNHAIQDTSTLQPVLIHNHLNSKPVVRFTGGKRYLTVANHSSLNLKQVSIIAVARRTGGTSGVFVLRNGDGTTPDGVGYSLIFSDASTVQFRVNGYSEFGDLPVSGTTSFNVLEGSFDQLYSTVHVNGVLAPTPRAQTGEARANVGDLTVGAADYGSALDGDIAELLVYDHGLGEAERKGLLDYLYKKYGVGPQATLDAPTLKFSGGAVAVDGTYAAAEELFITAPTAPAGAVIRYTLDGSSPTSASPAFANKMDLDSSKTVKAVVTAAGFADSPAAVLRFVYRPNPDLPTDNGAPALYQADSDGDGVPDAIESAIGSDSSDPADTGGGIGRTYQYDAIHQLTNDGVKTYNYDAEGNVNRN